MSSARNNILQRLRQAPQNSPLPLRDTQVLEQKTWSEKDRRERFSRLCQAANIELIDSSPARLATDLSRLIDRKGIAQLALGETERVNTLRHALQSQHPSLQFSNVLRENRPVKEACFEADAGLTEVAWGIAETGSLVLWPWADEPRQLSLAPPIHIALLDSRKIRNSLWEVMLEERWNERMPSNAVVISGPSKTADIEQTLCYGAHGPREVVLFLLSPDSQGADNVAGAAA